MIRRFKRNIAFLLFQLLLAGAYSQPAWSCQSVITGHFDNPLSLIRVSGSLLRWQNPCLDFPATLQRRLKNEERSKLTITGYLIVAGSASLELAQTTSLMASVMSWLLQQGIPRNRIAFGPYVLVMDKSDPNASTEDGGNWVELGIEP